MKLEKNDRFNNIKPLPTTRINLRRIVDNYVWASLCASRVRTRTTIVNGGDKRTTIIRSEVYVMIGDGWEALQPFEFDIILVNHLLKGKTEDLYGFISSVVCTKIKEHLGN